jgi:hypothetical protein
MGVGQSWKTSRNQDQIMALDIKIKKLLSRVERKKFPVLPRLTKDPAQNLTDKDKAQLQTFFNAILENPTIVHSDAWLLFCVSSWQDMQNAMRAEEERDYLLKVVEKLTLQVEEHDVKVAELEKIIVQLANENEELRKLVPSEKLPEEEDKNTKAKSSHPGPWHQFLEWKSRASDCDEQRHAMPSIPEEAKEQATSTKTMGAPSAVESGRDVVTAAGDGAAKVAGGADAADAAGVQGGAPLGGSTVTSAHAQGEGSLPSSDSFVSFEEVDTPTSPQPKLKKEGSRRKSRRGKSAPLSVAVPSPVSGSSGKVKSKLSISAAGDKDILSSPSSASSFALSPPAESSSSSSSSAAGSSFRPKLDRLESISIESICRQANAWASY